MIDVASNTAVTCGGRTGSFAAVGTVVAPTALPSADVVAATSPVEAPANFTVRTPRRFPAKERISAFAAASRSPPRMVTSRPATETSSPGCSIEMASVTDFFSSDSIESRRAKATTRVRSTSSVAISTAARRRRRRLSANHEPSLRGVAISGADSLRSVATSTTGSDIEFLASIESAKPVRSVASPAMSRPVSVLAPIRPRTAGQQ